jgi:putative transposase
MPRSRYRFGDDHFPYFITNTIVAWLPVFSQPEFASVVIESWNFLQKERAIDLMAFVVMENHVHWIGAGPDLAKRVGEFKSFSATSIIKRMQAKGYDTLLQELSFYKARHKLDQDHQLWQEGSHPQQIDSDEMMWQKIEYIHNNPLRRGYIDDPTHWRYSSARAYAGQKSLVEVYRHWH